MADHLGLLALRVCLGTIFIVHGADKLGWGFGTLLGQENLLAYSHANLEGFTRMLAGSFDFMTPDQLQTLALVTAIGELLCGWALVLGVLAQVAALYLCLFMAVAVYLHLPQGFYAANGGYEWAMLCLAGSVAVLLQGPGPLSVSGLIRSLRSTSA